MQSAKNNGLQICLKDIGGFSLQREILFFVPHHASLKLYTYQKMWVCAIGMHRMCCLIYKYRMKIWCGRIGREYDYLFPKPLS